MENKTRKEQIEETAQDILLAAESVILMNLRFMQTAIATMKWKPLTGFAQVAANGEAVYYDPALIIRKFKNSNNSVVRIYLHVLFHFIFHHNYEYEKKRNTLWDLAADIAVENIIMELGLSQTALPDDAERLIKLQTLKERAGGLHVNALYRLFLVEEPSIREMEDLDRLFTRDSHDNWVPEKIIETSMAQWLKIAERIKADLKSFSKGKTDSESMRAALDEATRERINYKDFLQRFMVSGEQIHVNEDEFDYVYYTYGLSTYGNMPLVEPLEYADMTKVKELVVAIDTSASCKGELVKTFLQKTVEIISENENFFHKYTVHILQCDTSVRSDTVINGKEDMDKFIKECKIEGFGSTDFRPVFEYVDGLKEKGELSDLKGLIYFTDGFGVYPEKMPEYDAAFVFLSDDGTTPAVPEWAIRIVLDEDQIMQ